MRRIRLSGGALAIAGLAAVVLLWSRPRVTSADQPAALYIPIAAIGAIQGTCATPGANGPADAPPPLNPPGDGPLVHQGFWFSQDEIHGLSQNGPAWEHVLDWAQESTDAPQLRDQNDDTDAAVVAKALVYAATGQPAFRAQVVNAIRAAMGTEDGGNALALGRNLTGFIVAADLVELDPMDDVLFRTWLYYVRCEVLDDRSLITTHEERPNNWGTHAGAARIAAALYLGDAADLQRAADVFHGYVGDRTTYAGFDFGDLSWQCNPAAPVGINPAGCTLNGFPVDGVLPDDQRRSGPFTWPPPQENYVWEALQGAVAQAWMLERAGYPAFSWENQALLRAVTWLHSQANFPAAGDDRGTPWLVNHVYSAAFPAASPAAPGKNGLGFYDWYFS